MGDYIGSTIGVTKGDARTLGSYEIGINRDI